jgi:hypothetical protein
MWRYPMASEAESTLRESEASSRPSVRPCSRHAHVRLLPNRGHKALMPSINLNHFCYTLANIPGAVGQFQATGNGAHGTVHTVAVALHGAPCGVPTQAQGPTVVSVI